MDIPVNWKSIGAAIRDNQIILLAVVVTMGFKFTQRLDDQAEIDAKTIGAIDEITQRLTDHEFSFGHMGVVDTLSACFLVTERGDIERAIAELDGDIERMQSNPSRLNEGPVVIPESMLMSRDALQTRLGAIQGRLDGLSTDCGLGMPF